MDGMYPQVLQAFNSLLLLGLSAGLLASCSSVTSRRVLAIGPLHGTVSFVSV